MQTLQIEIEDSVLDKLLNLLNSFQGVKKIEKIENVDRDLEGFEILQIDSMQSTWDNKKDEAWDEYL